ncbi:MAG TPA: hypothetical protein PLU39_08355 [Armatimonadota bacterium]|jgi:uncharacterized membrane protein YeaQ/YmgE (transglycosylase-associated protein family)|nr:hypothetical protein [Armatimonadota bacterium]HOJ23586.1 hypothetical protein [Armatimonadota bacterium]HOM83072.1 hypothetical protein [Armatimonadota bacterium]HPO73194.1 hypothetical protein [Armatimonadota bacterium]HPT97867.1 hypothetical protein [Armatimonadota bacterium]
MRRTQPRRVQEGRGGCQGAILGLILGVVAGALIYNATGASEVVAIVLGVIGLFLGAQVGQRLARRRQRR